MYNFSALLLPVLRSAADALVDVGLDIARNWWKTGRASISVKHVLTKVLTAMASRVAQLLTPIVLREAVPPRRPFDKHQYLAPAGPAGEPSSQLISCSGVEQIRILNSSKASAPVLRRTFRQSAEVEIRLGKGRLGRQTLLPTQLVCSSRVSLQERPNLLPTLLVFSVPE
ncbi:hypothetical protein SUNI508_11789 [Seiridium unicorne]|uniref:Uncharacterized protein n=1 Tax=Seiridium unicorne TaxID=138068 RepID=A0ABR2UGI7_9PEZI